jgi:hypothetical protein
VIAFIMAETEIYTSNSFFFLTTELKKGKYKKYSLNEDLGCVKIKKKRKSCVLWKTV